MIFLQYFLKNKNNFQSPKCLKTKYIIKSYKKMRLKKMDGDFLDENQFPEDDDESFLEDLDLDE